MNAQNEQSEGQQHLPEPAEVEVLEALEAEPVPGRASRMPWMPRQTRRSACRRRPPPGRRAARRRACPGAWAHAARSWARGRCPRPKRRGDPEEGELHVPGARQVVRERSARGRIRRSRRSRRDSVARRRRPASGARTARPSRRRTRRIARWAGVSATSPGGGTTALPARDRASPGIASARRRRTKCRCRPTARSGTERSRRSRWRSAGCRLVARAASCWCRSSRGPGGWSSRPRPSIRRRPSVGAARCGSVIASGRSPCLVVGSEKKRGSSG